MTFEAEDTGIATGSRPGDYDGFISYSHAADNLLAPRLQAGLQRFAKPWWKLRALRIFRDETSLSANPRLWSSITVAMEESSWFVLLLSPGAAKSKWVNDEIAYWLEHKDRARIIPVLTEGEFSWEKNGLNGDAVPPALHGVFAEEPRWVDLRFARGDEDLDLKNPAFSAAVADIASAMRGVPKEELASEEVRQHRRTRRLALSAAVALLTLTTMATGIGIYAFNQRQEALENAALASDNEAIATARELSFASRGVADDDPELGVLLGLEALGTTDSAGLDALAKALSATWHSFSRHRVDVTIDGAGHLSSAFSPDGRILVSDMADDPSTAAVWDSETGRKLGSLEGPEPDGDGNGTVTGLRFTTDGSHILVSRFWSPDYEASDVPAVDIFDAWDFSRVGSLTGPPDEYRIIDSARSGHVLAFSARTSTTYVWDLTAPSASVATHDGQPIGFYLSGRLILASELLGEPGEETGNVFAVDWEDGTRTPLSFATDIRPARIQLSPDQRKLAVSDHNNLLAVQSVPSGNTILGPRRFPNPQVLTWSPDSSLLAVSGSDSDVTIVDVESGEVSVFLTGPDAAVFSTAWSPDGKRLATVEHGGAETRIWNVDRVGPPGAGFVPVEGEGPFEPIADGGGLFRNVEMTGEPDREDGAQVVAFNGEVLKGHPFVTEFPNLAVISGDGSYVAGMYPDGFSAVTTVSGGSWRNLGCSRPRALSWDGSMAAVAAAADCDDGANRPAGVIDVVTGEQLIELGNEPLFLASFTSDLTFDGTEYVALLIGTATPTPGEPPSRVEVWATDPARKVGAVEDTVAGSYFLLPRFSRDGRFLGIGTAGPTAVVIDVERMVSGAPDSEFIVFNQDVHTGNTPLVIPTSNGKTATGSFDGFYRLWDTATGERLMEIDVREKSTIPSLGFSSDESIFYYNQKGSIGAVPTDTDEMVELARSSVTRSLTDDECREYLHRAEC